MCKGADGLRARAASDGAHVWSRHPFISTYKFYFWCCSSTLFFTFSLFVFSVGPDSLRAGAVGDGTHVWSQHSLRQALRTRAGEACAIDSPRECERYRRRLGSSPSMSLLVFWPRADAVGARAVLLPCAQLLWCELYVMKDLSTKKTIP